MSELAQAESTQMDDAWVAEFVSGDYYAPGAKKSVSGRDVHGRRAARKGGWHTQSPNGTLSAAGAKALGMPPGCPVRIMVHAAHGWSSGDHPGEAFVAFSSRDHGEWVKRGYVRPFSMDECK